MIYELGFYLLATLFLLYWLYKPSSKTAKRLGLTFLGIGFLIFLFELIYASLSSNNFTFSIFQFIANTAVALFYVILIKFKDLKFIKFSPVVSSFALLFSLLGLKLGTFQNENHILTLHILTSILSFSFLLLSSIFSVFKIVSENKLKKGQILLPLGLPLNLWIKLERQFFFFGFIFLTLDLVLSFILLQLTLKSITFDSRICATLILWIYYILLFHLERFSIEPFKSKFSYFNICGAMLIIITLLFTHHNFKSLKFK